MSIRDTISVLEQQLFVACSENDYDTVNLLEHQLEYLHGKLEHPSEDAPCAINTQFEWQRETTK
ncbi:hypothetical protein [Vibrio sagamiensis]|uniref:Uncharacterized protein n=1 Tax=Vibrio sagamiensis NBRC 104589 TaxID=1219064 RepID=A0A511QF31_9VIBR|nr:hypothetical protein [Vibrio sagamiensis]PNQ55570.1 hypothetical protein C1141_14365 [Vibrio agarivorans]GEM75776.1 hypothetical protein VSA01S_18880 [Vibrio sagamiensis NBRC 104589]